MSGPRETSGTNNQEPSVDEADFVKHDGQHAYVAANGSLRIIAIWPPESARELSKVKLAGTPLKLFLHQDRIVVYSSTAIQTAPGCSYGYDCDLAGDGSGTIIEIFDVRDRTAPKLMRKLEHTGSFIAARRVGDSIHTVLSQGGHLISTRPWFNICTTPTEVEIREAFAELGTKNEKLIREGGIGDLPKVADHVFDDGEPRVVESVAGNCQELYAASRAVGAGFLTLLSFDIASSLPASASTILSRPGAVYSAENSLYVSVRDSATHGSPWFSGYSELEHASLVHKFKLEGATNRYVASGLVKGHVLNQFSMDEHDGYLRIVTTSGRTPSPDVHSTISVLEQHGRDLRRVGVLDDIAPTEDIRSVRFDGERAFVVTFKKTDPLFYIDLSNPKRPHIRGELKIPGFSTYMQLMDENHLLSIGYDATDEGGFALFQGVLLQIFNVSDPSAPSLVHKEVIGARGSSSEALNDHLAFTYFAPKGLLLVPATVCENARESDATQLTFSGLKIYDVSVASGFALRGQVSHPTDNASCYSWWTRATSEVKRSIVMDDWIYSLSQRLMKVNSLSNLERDTASISIEN